MFNRHQKFLNTKELFPKRKTQREKIQKLSNQFSGELYFGAVPANIRSFCSNQPRTKINRTPEKQSSMRKIRATQQFDLQYFAVNVARFQLMVYIFFLFRNSTVPGSVRREHRHRRPSRSHAHRHRKGFEKVRTLPSTKGRIGGLQKF
jgi:hypothetical protein